jgi:hypothetical protein
MQPNKLVIGRTVLELLGPAAMGGFTCLQVKDGGRTIMVSLLTNQKML